VLQFDHVRKCNYQFVQFGQNNVIGIYFTVGKHGVAKDMNRSLLEMVRCLLSNAQLTSFLG